MASEFSLALVLLVGAGLMVRSFLALQAIDPGLVPRGVLTLRVSVSGTPESSLARRTAFYRAVLEGSAVCPASNPRAPSITFRSPETSGAGRS